MLKFFPVKGNSKNNCKNQLKHGLRSKYCSGDISDPKKLLDQYLNSTWLHDESIGLEQAFNSHGLHNGRSIFLDDKFIHSYFYL